MHHRPRASSLVAVLLALAAVSLIGCAAVPLRGSEDSTAQQPAPGGATDLPLVDGGPTTDPGGAGAGTDDPDNGAKPAPDDPVVSDPQPPDGAPPAGGALAVEPEPGIVDARPHAVDRIVVAPDGRSLTAFYWGGIQDCYGLAAVNVERAADGSLSVTVFEGWRAALPPNTACIEIALLKSVTVDLD